MCVAVSKLTKSKVGSLAKERRATQNTDKRETLERLTFSRRSWSLGSPDVKRDPVGPLPALV